MPNVICLILAMIYDMQASIDIMDSQLFPSKKCLHELSSVADLTLAADGAKTVQGAEVKSD